MSDDFALEECRDADPNAGPSDGSGEDPSTGPSEGSSEGDVLEELPLAERLAEKQHQRVLTEAAAAAKAHAGSPAAAVPDQAQPVPGKRQPLDAMALCSAYSCSCRCTLNSCSCR